jgi:hypothetical protein
MVLGPVELSMISSRTGKRGRMIRIKRHTIGMDYLLPRSVTVSGYMRSYIDRSVFSVTTVGVGRTWRLTEPPDSLASVTCMSGAAWTSSELKSQPIHDLRFVFSFCFCGARVSERIRSALATNKVHVAWHAQLSSGNRPFEPYDVTSMSVCGDSSVDLSINEATLLLLKSKFS